MLLARRRTLMLLAWASSLPLLLRSTCSLPAEDAAASRTAQLRGLIREPGLARMLGRVYRTQWPEEADAGTLTRLLWRDLGLSDAPGLQVAAPSREQLWAALDSRVRATVRQRRLCADSRLGAGTYGGPPVRALRIAGEALLYLLGSGFGLVALLTSAREMLPPPGRDVGLWGGLVPFTEHRWPWVLVFGALLALLWLVFRTVGGVRGLVWGALVVGLLTVFWWAAAALLLFSPLPSMALPRIRSPTSIGRSPSAIC